MIILVLNESSFCMSCSGSAKVEDAVECYQRAANLFKMAKNWTQAGSAFCEAANLHAKAGSRHDAATNYVDAANCYKKCEVEGKQNTNYLLACFAIMNLIFRGCKLFASCY